MKSTKDLMTEANPPGPECPFPDRVCKCGAIVKPVRCESPALGNTPAHGFWSPAPDTCEACYEKERKAADANIEQKLLISGLPWVYLKMKLENYKCAVENEKSFLVIEQYVREPAGGIFITGSCGVGKTHLAAAIARKLILQDRKCHFEVVPELLLHIKSEIFEKQSISEEDFIEKYSDYEYLILDDIGAEKVTEWTLQTLYLIFDRRLRRGKTKMIITSNLGLPQIETELSERISSRIAGMCRVLKLTGDDYRLKRKG